MLPDRLHPVTVTLYRYGAQTQDATTGLPSSSATTSSLTMQEEPWRPDASPPRPDGETAQTSRLFVSRSQVRGVGSEGTATGARADRIGTTDGSVWRVVEVVAAPALGPIPAAWHAYCVRVEPEDGP